MHGWLAGKMPSYIFKRSSEHHWQDRGFIKEVKSYKLGIQEKSGLLPFTTTLSKGKYLGKT